MGAEPRARPVPRLAIVVAAVAITLLVTFAVVQAVLAPEVLETRSIGPCPSGSSPDEALCYPT